MSVEANNMPTFGKNCGVKFKLDCLSMEVTRAGMDHTTIDSVVFVILFNTHFHVLNWHLVAVKGWAKRWNVTTFLPVPTKF